MISACRTLESVAVLIPVWQPDGRLSELVSRLIESGFGAIIIVNDGSDRIHDEMFRRIGELGANVHIAHHDRNFGKGRALKTGLNYFLKSCPDYAGVVTADADGQHSPEAIVATAEGLQHGGREMILGSRQFQGAVPIRSRVGNAVTRYVFTLLTGRKLADTQSGLRALPTELVPFVLGLDGERYEYEMNVLTRVAGMHGIREVPIETIYLDGNRSSHFSPVRDSMRIYFVLLRFVASSLAAAGIDFLAFTAIFWLTSNVALSIVAGRVSSLANFALNRRFVFHSGTGLGAALAKYYALVLVIAAASYYAISYLSGRLGMNVVAAKAIAETILWLISFSIQRKFVFARMEQ